MQTSNTFSLLATLLFLGLSQSALAGHGFICKQELIDSLKANDNTIIKAIQADAPMKDICPNMVNSCCSYSRLFSLVESYMEGRKELEKVRSLYEKVYQMLAVITDEKVNLMMEKSKAGTTVCFSTQEEGELLVLAKKLMETRGEMDITLNQFMDGVAKYYAGVACSVCDASNNQSFYGVTSQGSYVSFSVKNYYAVFDIMSHYANLEKFFVQASRLSKLGLCAWNQNFDYFNSTPGEDQVVVNIYEKCKSLNEYLLKSLENTVCLKIFNRTSINQLNLFKDTKEYFESLLRGLMLITQSPDNQIYFDQSPDAIVFFELKTNSVLANENLRLLTGMNNAMVLENSEFSTQIWIERKKPSFNYLDVLVKSGIKSLLNK